MTHKPGYTKERGQHMRTRKKLLNIIDILLSNVLSCRSITAIKTSIKETEALTLKIQDLQTDIFKNRFKLNH